jgi:polysaccharide export outer membrane protein
MKNILPFLLILLILVGCTSKKKLAYLENIPESPPEHFFTMEIPDYRLQYRDVIYVTIKAMAVDGTIKDFLSPNETQIGNSAQGEGGGYLYGYDIKKDGEIILPVLGKIKIDGLTLDESRILIQSKADSIFNKSTVECKLLSFKYTVIGEVRSPGTYVNYNNYLTVLEAIGKAGGVADFGSRERIRIVRTMGNGTKTYTLNLQDKNILTSQAYFLLPNDVVIVDPESGKLFNLNFPPFAAILATITSLITTTLLMIDYFNN